MEEDQDRAVAFGNRLLRVVEDVVYIAIAALLAIGAAVLLVEAGGQVIRAATKGDVSGAMLDMLDTLLLVFIFAELLFAVRSTLAERRI
ncbi:MAG TPA: phosphate-starvation-inducible PsiE family protein, partial [Mycobacteriales bacterium]